MDDSGLNIYEQEMVQVMDQEGGTPRITKRDNSGGYQEKHEELERIVLLKHVSPWNFSCDSAGWSGDDRATELSIEANLDLVDPDVCWELKNNCLHRYRSLVSIMFQRDHIDDHPTTMGPIPDAFSVNLAHDDNIAQYLKDREAGLYDQFKTDAGETVRYFGQTSDI